MRCCATRTTPTRQPTTWWRSACCGRGPPCLRALFLTAAAAVLCLEGQQLCRPLLGAALLQLLLVLLELALVVWHFLLLPYLRLEVRPRVRTALLLMRLVQWPHLRVQVPLQVQQQRPHEAALLQSRLTAKMRLLSLSSKPVRRLLRLLALRHQQLDHRLHRRRGLALPQRQRA